MSRGERSKEISCNFALPAEADDEQQGISAYEQKRLDNIAENKRMLEELGLVRDPVLSPNSAGEGVQGERRSGGKAREGEGKKASEPGPTDRVLWSHAKNNH